MLKSVIGSYTEHHLIVIGVLFMAAVIFLPKGTHRDRSFSDRTTVLVLVHRIIMNAPILEVRGLSVRFGGLRAVDNVSFTIARNRITAVIGLNGAGKSTLFNLISGPRPPHAGRVLIEGVDYTTRPPYRRLAAGLARSFQITNLFFH